MDDELMKNKWSVFRCSLSPVFVNWLIRSELEEIVQNLVASHLYVVNWTKDKENDQVLH